VQSNVSSGGRI